MKALKRMAKKQISLRRKIFILFGGLCSLIIITLMLIRMFGVPLMKDDGAISRIRMQALKQIEVVADYKQTILENWLTERQLELKRLSQNKNTQMILQRCLYGQETATAPVANIDNWHKEDFIELSQQLQFFVANSSHVNNIVFANAATGRIVATSGPITESGTIEEKTLSPALAKPRVIAVEINHSQKHVDCTVVFTLAVADPKTGNPVGVLIATYRLADFLQPLLHSVPGLGQTGELVLVDQRSVLLSHLKFPLQSGTQGIVHQTKITAHPALMAAAGNNMLIAKSVDYRGESVMAASRSIKINSEYQWGLVVKQDRSEALQLLMDRVYGAIAIGLISLMLVLLGVFIIARQLTQPFKQLSSTADRIREGDFTARAVARGSIEESNLADVFNSMVERLADWQQALSVEVAIKTAELDQAYKALQQTERQRSSIGEISDFYLRNGTLQPALELLIQQLLHFTGGKAGRYRSCEIDAGGAIQLTPMTKIIFAPINDKYAVDHTLAASINDALMMLAAEYDALMAKVLQQRQVLILDEEQCRSIENMPRVDGKPVITALLIMPVTKGEQIYGLITLANKPGGFSNKDKEMVAGFSSAAALVINADKRERARVVAEETAQIKGQFLANMSHELRTPMNVVIGMSNLLLDTELNGTQQEYLQKIDNSSRQLLALINDILDSSKLESGHQLTLNLTPFEPEQLFRNVINLHTYNIDERQVELHVDIDRAVPRLLIGDSQRLEQVLNNLLGNAIKFTQSGDIILAVKVIQSSKDEVTLEFSVNDSGIGIEAGQQEQMFHPFTQADSSSTRQQGGTGLGLTISRQLCRLMGSELTAESTIGEGSTFRFALPFEVLVAEEKGDHALLTTNELQGMHVLVVDDNHIGQRILEEILNHMHFRVELASSGKQALIAVTKAEENNDPFRLIILDTVMPEMSGLELAQRLTQQHPSSALQILMMTVRQQQQLKVRALDAGIGAIVTKPIQPSPLFDTIMQVFNCTTTTTTTTTNQSMGWENITVLLVEDHALNRQVARELLEKVGITVAEAINGAVAVEMVKNNAYDLVLMDIQMPVMDGHAAARAIRKLGSADIQQLPIIAMTANAFEQDRQKSINSGMNAHINKPVAPAELYSELKRWLPQHKQVTLTYESPSTEVPLPTTLPGVDMTLGLRYADGDHQRYYRLLRSFVAHFAETETLLRQELAAGQQQQAALHIHSLKGAAGTLGAIELQAAAAQLESQLRENAKPEAMNMMLQLFNPLLLACAALPMLDDKIVSDAAAKIVGNAEQLQEILTCLAPALENLQAQVCKKLVTQLRETNWPSELSTEIIHLQDLIDRYRYNEALELVKKLRD